MTPEEIAAGRLYRAAKSREKREREALRVEKIKGSAGEATERGSMTPYRRATVFAFYQGKCAKCGDLLLGEWHGDHIVPLALGGLDGMPNIEALCVPCHRKKTADDVARIAKAKRQARNHFLGKPKPRRRLQSRGLG